MIWRSQSDGNFWSRMPELASKRSASQKPNDRQSFITDLHLKIFLTKAYRKYACSWWIYWRCTNCYHHSSYFKFLNTTTILKLQQIYKQVCNQWANFIVLNKNKTELKWIYSFLPPPFSELIILTPPPPISMCNFLTQ